MKFCTQCGTRLADDARFCVSCGAATAPNVPEASTQEPQAVSEATIQEPQAVPEANIQEPQVVPEAPVQAEAVDFIMPDAPSENVQAQAQPENVSPTTEFTSQSNDAQPTASILQGYTPQPANPAPNYTGQPVNPAQNYAGQPVYAPQQVYSAQPVMQNGYNNANVNDPGRINAIIDTVSDVLNSPVFLFAILAFTLTSVLSLINVFTSGVDFSSIQNYLGEAGEFYSMYGENSVNAMTIIIGLVGFIPTVLYLIGAWKIYAERMNKPVAPNGFSLIKAGAIINLIFICVVCGFAVVVLILGMTSINVLDSYYNFNAAYTIGSAIMVFAIILIIGMAVMYIFYYSKLQKSAKVAAEAASKGILIGNISIYVAILNFIISGFQLLSIGSSDGILGVLTVFSTIAFRITFGICLLQLRTKLTAFNIKAN